MNVRGNSMRRYDEWKNGRRRGSIIWEKTLEDYGRKVYYWYFIFSVFGFKEDHKKVEEDDDNM